MKYKYPTSPWQMKKFFEDVRTEYRKGRPEILTPTNGEERIEGIVGASSIADCTLKEAFRKARVEPNFPELTLDNDSFGQYKVDYGNYTAAMFVEPMVWLAKRELDFAAEYEPHVISSRMNVQGFLDLLLTFRINEFETKKVVVEIKNSQGKNGQLGSPRLSHAYQTMAYMEAVRADAGYILIDTKAGFTIHEVKSVGDGEFRILDDSGDWHRPDYNAKWNDPSVLNYTTLRERVQAHYEKRSQVADWQERMLNADDIFGGLDFDEVVDLVPEEYKDWTANRGQTWMCASILFKGKKYVKKGYVDKPAVIKPNCPYSGYCHGFKTSDKFEIDAIEDTKDEDPTPVGIN